MFQEFSSTLPLSWDPCLSSFRHHPRSPVSERAPLRVAWDQQCSPSDATPGSRRRANWRGKRGCGGLAFPVHNDLASTATLHVNCFLPASLPEHFSDSIIIFLSLSIPFFSLFALSSLFDPLVRYLLLFSYLFVCSFSPYSPSLYIYLLSIFLYPVSLSLTASPSLVSEFLPISDRAGHKCRASFSSTCPSPRRLEKKSRQGRLLIALRGMQGER